MIYYLHQEFLKVCLRVGFSATSAFPSEIWASLFDQDTQSYRAMSDFALKKVFLPAALTTGAVFVALTAPMFVFAAQPAKVQVLGAELPGEQVRDYALPYLGLAGLVSTGIGLSGAAVMGLRRSSKQASSLDEKREVMQRQLDERTTYVQQALSSDSYLAKSGLDFFLDDEMAVAKQAAVTQLSELIVDPNQTIEPVVQIAVPTMVAAPVPLDSTALRFDDLPGLEAFFLGEGAGLVQAEMQESPAGYADVVVAAPRVIAQPVVIAAPVPHVVAIAQPTEPSAATALLAPAQSVGAKRPAPFTVIAATPMEPVVLQVAPKPVTAQMAVMPLTAAQGFLSYSRFSREAAGSQAPWNPVMAAQEQAALAKIQALQTQLQQIVVQIETLQTNLQVDGQDAPSQGWVAAAAPQRVSAAELNWNNQAIAS
jgi:hypothetical protein